ncbi:MAG: outer membrane beta-barrel protein [Desulfuromusa sp.]|nr:outer membrane beta-barrel protein [Desulfuromusa sp.]
MKKISVVFLVLALVVGLGVPIAGAEIYYSGNMGIVSASDSDIDDGFDTGELSFDDGFAVTGALGQTLGSTGRVEVELGYRTNNIDKIKIDGLGIANIDGDVTTLSLMGNGYYDIVTGSNFTPFIGAGIGVANIKAKMDLVGSEDDTVFAYQLAAGGSLAINKNLSVDLQYRYFATADPDFDGLEAEYNTHNLIFGLRLTF